MMFPLAQARPNNPILKVSVFIVGFNFTGYKVVVVIAMLLVDPCHKVVATLLLLSIFVTRLLQGCYNLVITMLLVDNLVTRLLQPCMTLFFCMG